MYIIFFPPINVHNKIGKYQILTTKTRQTLVSAGKTQTDPSLQVHGAHIHFWGGYWDFLKYKVQGNIFAKLGSDVTKWTFRPNKKTLLCSTSGTWVIKWQMLTWQISVLNRHDTDWNICPCLCTSTLYIIETYNMKVHSYLGRALQFH